MTMGWRANIHDVCLCVCVYLFFFFSGESLKAGHFCNDLRLAEVICIKNLKL